MALGLFLRPQELLQSRFRFDWIRLQLLLSRLKNLGLLLEVRL